MGTSPVYYAVYRAPWGRRFGYHREENADISRENRHRRMRGSKHLYSKA